MKQINKFFISSVASLFFAGQVFAEQNPVNKTDVEAEIAQHLNVAIAQIETTAAEKTAKTQLDEMAFRQHVEQFLLIANYNEETKTVKPQLVAE